ncbi:MAG: helix-turn-helix transcriptional regulator [Bdellovibrionales bacterium]|nr:helix-turn-helix transcriptional regulator [Bdellovibrionales bacterium]
MDTLFEEGSNFFAEFPNPSPIPNIGSGSKNFSMVLANAEQRLLRQLGLRICQVRESKGWTLEEAEEHGWPSWRHLQRIESGKNVTFQSLARIAKVFNLSLSEFLNGIE